MFDVGPRNPVPTPSVASTTALPLNARPLQRPLPHRRDRDRQPARARAQRPLGEPASRPSTASSFAPSATPRRCRPTCSSGDVDLVPGDGVGLTLDQVLALQAQYPKRFAYAYKPNLAYSHIDLQLDNPILADVRVRRALLMGIDRQAIVDKLHGRARPRRQQLRQPARAAVHRRTCRPTPTTRQPPGRCWRRPDGRRGTDGVCRNAAGQRLSLQFSIADRRARARELQQQVMQSQWRSIGVDDGDQERAAPHPVRRNAQAPRCSPAWRCSAGAARSRVRRGRCCRAARFPSASQRLGRWRLHRLPQ